MLYTTPEFFEELLDLLRELDGLTYRPAMGDYHWEYQGKIVGGVYANRFLIKITPSSLALLSPTAYCIPYPGAKEMLLVERREKEFLIQLIQKTAEDLPAQRRSYEDH